MGPMQLGHRGGDPMDGNLASSEREDSVYRHRTGIGVDLTTTRSKQDVALMAHLLRRASFGASGDELERYLDLGYDATVDELLNPADCDNIPYDLVRRYHVEQSTLRSQPAAKALWVYRMATTECPLREKMALFWHRVFATAATKLIQARVVVNQIDMFREYGMGRFNKLLVQLSKNPAMLMWLDNQDNHKSAVNENFGREILELFSMGPATTRKTTSRSARGRSRDGPSSTPRTCRSR